MAFKDYFKEFQPLQVNENILLRQIDVEHDIPSYTAMYNDESAFVFYEGYSKPRNDEQVRVICQNQIKEFATKRIYSWTIADAHTNEGIGRILLSDFQNYNTAANIGFFINRHYWGKGIATACVATVIKFGFEYMHLERIFTTVETNNIDSWKALEKNGFLREGKLRHSMMLKDGLHDCFMYAIIAGDYFANCKNKK
jgi:ribosomal-protein-alanine N-acetyltransferase